MPDHRRAFASTAWPLAVLYGLLIAFASLFPFTGWSWRGLALADIALAPIPPQYWTWFDVLGNAAGYVPLGFLLALAQLRSGQASASQAAARATLLAAALSLAMEALQMFLPQRVPSNLDWLLNTAGAAIGALAVLALHGLGAIARWQRFRSRWLPADHGAGLTLALLWPWALLFPAAVPFGLGQILWRLDNVLLAWFGVSAVHLAEGASFAPSGTTLLRTLCVAAGVAAPLLLVHALVEAVRVRVAFALALLATGVGATALSCALSFGPAHAWIWLDAPALQGLALGTLVCATLLAAAPRWCALALMGVLLCQLYWLNLMPASTYFTQTLQMWEQGRFIRFYGLGQWLGWAWPYAALLYAVQRFRRAHKMPNTFASV